MNSQPSVAAIVKQFGLFALLGLAVVILGGPLIGILSALLSIGAVVFIFALVGFAVWSVFQAAVRGPQAAVDGLNDVKHAGQDLIGRYGGNMKSMITWPVHALRGLIGGVLLVTAFLLKSAWNSFWFVTEVGIVAVVGVLVGGILGYATANPHEVEATAISHAIMGGVLATVAGVFLTLRERLAKRNAVPRFRFDSTAMAR